MSKVLIVSIAFRIFPVLCRLIAHKMSHLPAYTQESRDSLLCRTFYPCHIAASLPPSEDSHMPFPERRNSTLTHDRQRGDTALAGSSESGEVRPQGGLQIW